MIHKKIRFYDVLADNLIVAERMTFEVAGVVAEALDTYYEGAKQIAIIFSQKESEANNED